MGDAAQASRPGDALTAAGELVSRLQESGRITDHLWAEALPELTATLDVLVTLHVDVETLAACVLHTLTRQPGVVLDDAEMAGFSSDVRNLVESQQSAERVWSLYATRAVSGGTEGLRRLLLAMVRDLRVVPILLARQLVRMRASTEVSEDERQALARLTVDIHAPLANRLGIWQLKWELEDLAFRFLQPDVYRRIAHLLDERRDDRERWIANARGLLETALHDAGIDAEVNGRPKHIYSIWRKMQRKGLEFSDLYDVRALRVLVGNVGECYAALGITHSLWPHVHGEFDDYIANPKGNQYRSLHTAVIGPEGRTLEVQIRSHDMHEHAELGVAAHWRYKEGGSADVGFERKIAWMRQLLEARDGDEDDAQLLAGFRTDVIEDRIYVVTPLGEVVDLPLGATVVDFAYSVHTDVGHRCRGAKVNGRIVPLTFQPATGDRIEILTGKTSEPRRDWLSPQHGYLNTHRAREKVRSWFKRIDRQQTLSAGRTLLDRELKRLALGSVPLDRLPGHFHLKSHEDLLEALALGDVSPAQIARALHEMMRPAETGPTPDPTPLRAPRRAADAVMIEGVGNLLTQLARCCQPLPGDDILGYITRGRGVSVHRADCAQIRNLRLREANRVIEVEWGGQQAQAYEVNLLVVGYDRKWLHKDVTNVIAASNVHLLAVNTRLIPDHGIAEMNFAIRVSDFGQLSALIDRLLAVPNVTEARRLA